MKKLYQSVIVGVFLASATLPTASAKTNSELINLINRQVVELVTSNPENFAAYAQLSPEHRFALGAAIGKRLAKCYSVRHRLCTIQEAVQIPEITSDMKPFLKEFERLTRKVVGN
ncbi:MAG: hypothetical protein AB7P04_10280 [Bacteriovoracia bacterium]